MKMPIPWHEECLTNMRGSLQRAISIAKSAQMEVSRLTIDTQFLERQIDEAKYRGLDGFDRDRLLRTRTK